MEQDEVAGLKKEIARLNQIITVLLEQNEALKEKVDVAKSRNPFENDFVAFAESYKGNETDFFALTKSHNPPEINSVAVAESCKGNETNFVAVTKSRNPSETGLAAVAKTGSGNPEPFTQLPAFVPPSDLNIIKLNQILKISGFNKVRGTAIQNASRLILHFYNNGSGRSDDLEKLTGLSKFGLAKYIRSLKKRGLIMRDGWQKYKVTDYAIQLMQQAKCGA